MRDKLASIKPQQPDRVSVVYPAIGSQYRVTDKFTPEGRDALEFAISETVEAVENKAD